MVINVVFRMTGNVFFLFTDQEWLIAKDVCILVLQLTSVDI